MKGKPLGVGIIGMGNISNRHATAYQCLPELAQLIAVADIDPQRACAAKEKFGCKEAYTDPKQLLARDDIDVVSVCTPAKFHAPVVIDALEAGKHVLCEKPIAHTLAAADSILAAARKNPNASISIVYQNRSDPACARTRRLIQRGLLGDLLTATVDVRFMRTPAYYASAPGRGTWETDGGGAVVNQAIHHLDLLVSFLGDPAEVTAWTATFIQPIESEDTALAMVKFKSGAIATVHCTVCAHDEGFRIDVLGKNAAISIAREGDRQHCTWSLVSSSTAVARALRDTGERECPPAPEGPGANRILAQKVLCKLRGQRWLPPRHWGHTPHIEEFLRAVADGAPMPIPPEDARRSLEVSFAIYQSAIEGGKVTLPLTDRSPVYRGVEAGTYRKAAAKAIA